MSVVHKICSVWLIRATLNVVFDPLINSGEQFEWLDGGNCINGSFDSLMEVLNVRFLCAMNSKENQLKYVDTTLTQ
jgi:hypothetical protein